jgi:ACDE family multidrug resistance protein
MGILMAMSTLVFIIMAPIIGQFADKVGVLKLIIPLMAIYVFGALLNSMSAFLHSGQYILLLSGKALQGLGAIGTLPLSIPLTKQLLPAKAGAGVAWLEASASTGAVVGPIMGGLLSNIGWYYVFWVDGGLMLLLSLALYISFRNNALERENFGHAIKPSKELIPTNKKPPKIVIGVYISAFALMFSLVGMQAFLEDFFYVEFGTAIIISSAVVSLHALLMAISAAVSGPFLLQKRLKYFILSGLITFAIALFFVGSISNVVLISILLVLSGIGCGLILSPGNLLVMHEIDSDHHSKFISLGNSLRSLGAFLGSLILGYITISGYRQMFITNSLILLSLSVITAFAFFSKSEREISAGI